MKKTLTKFDDANIFFKQSFDIHIIAFIRATICKTGTKGATELL